MEILVTFLRRSIDYIQFLKFVTQYVTPQEENRTGNNENLIK
jgi:hypothetical protein